MPQRRNVDITKYCHKYSPQRNDDEASAGHLRCLPVSHGIHECIFKRNLRPKALACVPGSGACHCQLNHLALTTCYLGTCARLLDSYPEPC